MAVEVVMPKLGMAMKEGTVSLWNKEVGDAVGAGETIASISSEKIEMDVESPADGTILKIAVPEGEGVPPGTVICYIGNAGEEIISNEVNRQETSIRDVDKEPLKQKELSTVAVISRGDRVKISPVARKMAEAAKLDVEKIKGTGPGGRITKEDVQEAIHNSRSREAENVISEELPSQSTENARQVALSGIRKVIARRMQDSLQNSAQLTIMMKADVTELLKMQKQASEAMQKNNDEKLTVTDFLSRAAVLSLKEHLQMNSAYIDEKIHLFEEVHLGIAVALETGLVVPVIRHAEKCTIRQLSKASKELARRARAGRLSSEEMQGSTFTISNLGAYGVEHFTPILNPPETGILGVGAVFDTPVYLGDELKRRSILPLSLTFDHRVLDGAPASAFLQTLKRYLEEPMTMLL
ncbi:branched-chain alpha-keto acid dehydrogenase subunit E2 [Bacillus canaveralius]|uniref:Dihydrolipoamide acetyltransferase component of pyruvate dehydrogenase complex n=1 Tax=Bacillus canaveralius TaxID=1403243 RepID=A0A2N5GJD4_9BACI|nr:MULTISPECIES: dihydrolipoamide acetyltransferase family protein [Bacillus]PLR81295.1 branched-chain alpha-keto acid dehydrogenase subunit E2 [Bacillus canaveralius]PLR86488.1 branched-chain alpha-keto acid dehydrogenase subunit E2 [Bacillus sp. V33-4]PLS00513.1 branched-chain alpha-keto acid dehydrogenase subunit E2 [Bacillus canaveralius]